MLDKESDMCVPLSAIRQYGNVYTATGRQDANIKHWHMKYDLSRDRTHDIRDVSLV